MRITTPTNIVDHFYLEGGRNNADLTNIADLTNNADQVGMWIAWKYGSKHNADQLGIRISFHIAYQLGMWISTQCGPAWLCPIIDNLVHPPPQNGHFFPLLWVVEINRSREKEQEITLEF